MSALVTLNNGLKMPLIGLGCWKIPNKVCAEQVYDAIKLGYRLFDGATDYGNEAEVGQGIKKAIDDKIVTRADLFIVSKLWNSFHRPEHVRLNVKKNLEDLGLDYVDLYYIHFPIAFKFVPIEERYPPSFYSGIKEEAQGIIATERVGLADTYHAMEALVDEGLIKSIGISNYNGGLVQDVLNYCRIKPVALQIEHHPYLTQAHLVEYCKLNQIQIVAYSSFGPQSYVELKSEVAIETVPLFEHPTVKKIASAHGSDISTSQVLLRWATQQGVAIIPKSSKKERLLANLKVDETLTLTDDELKEINNLNKNLRFNQPWEWMNMKFPIFD
ncbi:similar to Saccharomyces cerevisiae YHR104W GRE3 Aldose reductase involved in methylglyoxal, d-xylose, arabinose, and galactose metabolism [Maudiozyma barnettii]|uniref:Similar to Saccharomyces cerevisiae YHR104W GRE3 Aldose reductase involved in methylglyoxal, d-xylose, arabinose, and galactose metabolism n=1 Tax=Maudiozyma barnettii TaxID=61262 RepID=A0A8H2VIV7_9SACH|nr:trifunctional aldehyde reductase/xylose reductase/glucose 1-dehydrogenase (NADP(+)) [Kazachstania barnettii]CAB4256236.1 similar to Saccharomyces cerevisiae YHR104W GRE3 Aldose reductase involved in methylglyoxal, d-xylose, arabinose, and galactose metabolism [Kazachstania barnettii]CAD1784845.1 similar to Saccharomyces cerevisiae YHR104W GRE3 Aldose reductase involved in methylglyoxal, d-xylose, arabinose, and galactose metabolism [Kazachstania barnettii]